MLALLVLTSLLGAHAQLTPLDEYVRREDNTYQFRLLRSENRTGEMIFYLNMTSQTWKDTSETTTPVWWHYLTLIVPTEYDTSLDSGLVMIGTGSNTDGFPNPDGDSKFRQCRTFAVRSGTVVAYLRQIPNQPITFVRDGSTRSEDDAIAYTWRRFLDNPDDPEILYRMPMTKAVIRAMDTTTIFMRDLGIAVNRYMLTGGSKRGWTAWVAGAVDPVPGRVMAIAPKVLSCLNFVENLHHHYRSLGAWTFAFFSYWAENVTQYLDHPHTQRMADVVDPYAYRHRLTMPKFYIGSASDEFFLPDDSHYWLNQMLPPMHFLLLENSGHSTSSSPRFNDMWHSMRNFYLHVAKGVALPTMSWMRNETQFTGSITLTTSTVPANVTGWWRSSNIHLDDLHWRDFRQRTYGIIEPQQRWEPVQVQNLGGNNYYLERDIPLEGWTAFFIEVQFPSLRGNAWDDRLTFSTEVNIIPDVMPVAKCSSPEECWGDLV